MSADLRLRTHRVAQAAYRCVAARERCEHKKQYGSLAHKLPGMILQNGLAQATGFLVAKGNPEHCALLDDLNVVLGATGNGSGTGATFHQKVIEARVEETMLLTRRCLDASAWIKRYVQGVLGVNSTGDDEAEES